LIRFLPELLKKRREESLYREYIAEALRILTVQGTRPQDIPYLSRKYTEILHPERQETRTAEEITADIVARCGLEVRHGSI
jgi:hypothetical protein